MFVKKLVEQSDTHNDYCMPLGLHPLRHTYFVRAEHCQWTVLYREFMQYYNFNALLLHLGKIVRIETISKVLSVQLNRSIKHLWQHKLDKRTVYILFVAKFDQ